MQEKLTFTYSKVVYLVYELNNSCNPVDSLNSGNTFTRNVVTFVVNNNSSRFPETRQNNFLISGERSNHDISDKVVE